MVKVCIDNCIFSYWLNRVNDSIYEEIEKIRLFIQEGKIQAIRTLEIELELVRGHDKWELDKINNGWKEVKLGFTITPSSIVGNASEAYNNLLNRLKRDWKKLEQKIYDEKDSKHLITAYGLHSVDYFLTTDKKFINKMRNEGKYFAKNIVVSPQELVEITNKSFTCNKDVCV